MTFSRSFRALLLLTAVLLGACRTPAGTVERSPGSGAPIDTSLPPSQTPSPTGPVVPPASNTPVPNPNLPPARSYPRSIQDSGARPAVVGLVKQAQDARAAGQPIQAQKPLESALRIDGSNAFVWLEFANLQADLKAWDQAEPAARKAIRFAHGNPYVEVSAWKLVAAARSAAGDVSGAFTARANADAAAARIAAP